MTDRICRQREGDAVLCIYPLKGGVLKKHESGTSEEIFNFVGKAVKQLLTPDKILQPHELAEALYHLSEETDNPETRGSCQEVIKMLMRKMH